MEEKAKNKTFEEIAEKLENAVFSIRQERKAHLSVKLTLYCTRIVPSLPVTNRCHLLLGKTPCVANALTSMAPIAASTFCTSINIYSIQ